MSRPPTAQARDNWKLLPKRVLMGALIADTFLLVAYALTVGLHKTPTAKPLIFLFGLNGEGNLPAWYSGMQLLLVGLVCLVVGSWIFQSDARVAPLRRLFVVLGLAFVYLSADEVGQVHENLSAVLQSWHPLNLFEIRLLAAIGQKRHKIHGGSIWIPLFAIIGVILLIWLWPQIRKAWKLWRTEILFLALGFGILVFGATVIETLGNVLKSVISPALEVGVEEAFEMVGASVVLYAATRVLAEVGGKLLPLSVTAPDQQPVLGDAEAHPEASPAE